MPIDMTLLDYSIPKRHKPTSKECLTQFIQNLDKYGAVLTNNQYLGSKVPHEIVCKNNHVTKVRPTDIQKGQGPCNFCRNIKVGEIQRLKGYAAFLNNLSRLNATFLDTEYTGSNRSYKIRCVNGHITTTMPGNLHQDKICKICGYIKVARKNLDRGYNTFISILDEHNAMLLDEYSGARKSYKIKCKHNHIFYVRPNDIQQYGIICNVCSNKFNVFYIVSNNTILKFGITSSTAHRIRTHYYNSFTNVLFYTKTNIDNTALILENLVKAKLKNAGYFAVRGREYFSMDVLPLVLQTLSEYNLVNEVEQ